MDDDGPAPDHTHLSRDPAFAALITECTDVAFALTDDETVSRVQTTPGFPLGDIATQAWEARPFAEIIAKDSAIKVAPLLASNAADNESATHWRHLNFTLFDHQTIPMLAKHFVFDTGDGPVRRVLCRDLRPVTEVQIAWQKRFIALDRKAEREREKLRSAAAQRGGTQELVGRAHLDDIVDAAVSEVTRMCINEALRKADGNTALAAEHLGITVDDLAARRRRLRKF